MKLRLSKYDNLDATTLIRVIQFSSICDDLYYEYSKYGALVTV